MKNPICSFLLLVATLLSCACSNRQDDPTGELPAWLNPRRQVRIPPAALQIHYRPPHRIDELKDALTPVAGSAVALVWPHLEGLRSFSVWVFEPPSPTPEPRARPDFVACLSGKITDWLYVGHLRTPEGTAVNFQKDRLWQIRIPWGPDPVHYLQDRGGRACLGSTESLTREALDWSAPAFPADGFLRVHGSAPSLVFLAKRVGLVATLKAWLPLSGAAASLAREFLEPFTGLETFSLDMNLGPELVSQVHLEMAWKDAPGFFSAPRGSRIPFTDRTMADLHLEFDRGRWFGLDLWPLIENELAEDLRPNVQKVLTHLQSIDVQWAMVDGGRLAQRVELRSEGQEDLMMRASEWLMEASAMDEDGNANEKSSVKELEKSADVHRWEYASTPAEDAGEREANNRLFGGTMLVECRKVNGGVVMTGGAAWPEGKPAPLPDDNQHVVFSLLQFFNYMFPLADVYAGNWPRFLGYPSVPRELWRLTVRFESPKKSMTIETTLPLGVFLRGLRKHPAFLKRLKFMLFPKPPAEAKPTDL